MSAQDALMSGLGLEQPQGMLGNTGGGGHDDSSSIFLSSSEETTAEVWSEPWSPTRSLEEPVHHAGGPAVPFGALRVQPDVEHVTNRSLEAPRALHASQLAMEAFQAVRSRPSRPLGPFLWRLFPRCVRATTEEVCIAAEVSLSVAPSECMVTAVKDGRSLPVRIEVLNDRQATGDDNDQPSRLGRGPSSMATPMQGAASSRRRPVQEILRVLRSQRPDSELVIIWLTPGTSPGLMLIELHAPVPGATGNNGNNGNSSSSVNASLSARSGASTGALLSAWHTSTNMAASLAAGGGVGDNGAGAATSHLYGVAGGPSPISISADAHPSPNQQPAARPATPLTASLSHLRVFGLSGPDPLQTTPHDDFRGLGFRAVCSSGALSVVVVPDAGMEAEVCALLASQHQQTPLPMTSGPEAQLGETQTPGASGAGGPAWGNAGSTAGASELLGAPLTNHAPTQPPGPGPALSAASMGFSSMLVDGLLAADGDEDRDDARARERFLWDLGAWLETAARNAATREEEEAVEAASRALTPREYDQEQQQRRQQRVLGHLRTVSEIEPFGMSELALSMGEPGNIGSSQSPGAATHISSPVTALSVPRSALELLGFACSRGWAATSSHVVLSLMDMGHSMASINAAVQAAHGWSALHLAAASGSAELVAMTALWRSYGRYGDSGAVQEEWRAMLAAPGPGGLTPLHLVAVLPQPATAALDLLSSLPAETLSTWFGAAARDGCTPAHYASRADNSHLNEHALLCLATGTAALDLATAEGLQEVLPYIGELQDLMPLTRSDSTDVDTTQEVAGGVVTGAAHTLGASLAVSTSTSTFVEGSGSHAGGLHQGTRAAAGTHGGDLSSAPGSRSSGPASRSSAGGVTAAAAVGHGSSSGASTASAGSGRVLLGGMRGARAAPAGPTVNARTRCLPFLVRGSFRCLGLGSAVSEGARTRNGGEGSAHGSHGGSAAPGSSGPAGQGTGGGGGGRILGNEAQAQQAWTLGQRHHMPVPQNNTHHHTRQNYPSRSSPPRQQPHTPVNQPTPGSASARASEAPWSPEPWLTQRSAWPDPSQVVAGLLDRVSPGTSTRGSVGPSSPLWTAWSHVLNQPGPSTTSDASMSTENQPAYDYEPMSLHQARQAARKLVAAAARVASSVPSAPDAPAVVASTAPVQGVREWIERREMVNPARSAPSALGPRLLAGVSESAHELQEQAQQHMRLMNQRLQLQMQLLQGGRPPPQQQDSHQQQQRQQRQGGREEVQAPVESPAVGPGQVRLEGEGEEQKGEDEISVGAKAAGGAMAAGRPPPAFSAAESCVGAASGQAADAAASVQEAPAEIQQTLQHSARLHGLRGAGLDSGGYWWRRRDVVIVAGTALALAHALRLPVLLGLLDHASLPVHPFAPAVAVATWLLAGVVWPVISSRTARLGSPVALQRLGLGFHAAQLACLTAAGLSCGTMLQQHQEAATGRPVPGATADAAVKAAAVDLTSALLVGLALRMCLGHGYAHRGSAAGATPGGSAAGATPGRRAAGSSASVDRAVEAPSVAASSARPWEDAVGRLAT